MLHRSFLYLIATFFLAASVASPGPSAAQDITGRVVAISDGDTLTLLRAGKRQVKVRLAEIDAPEKGQPYGTKAKQALSDLSFGKTVTALYVDTDRYGRTVARLYVGDVDVNAEMIRRGAAWAYRKYLTDETLLALEGEAKSARRGLWSLPEEQRVPPWEWRKRPAPESSLPEPAHVAAPFCGDKRYCKQMTSCAEARHYLQDCGLSNLDGNHDGVPCEALCP